MSNNSNKFKLVLSVYKEETLTFSVRLQPFSFTSIFWGFSHLPPPAPRPSSAGVVSLWLPSPAGVVCWCRNGLDHPNTTQLYMRTTHEEKLNYSLNCCFKQNRASHFQLIHFSMFKPHLLKRSEPDQFLPLVSVIPLRRRQNKSTLIQANLHILTKRKKWKKRTSRHNTIYPSTQVIHSRATALISHI